MRSIKFSIILIMVFCGSSVFSQVTISEADFAAVFPVGSTYTSLGDTTFQSVDIGQLGGPNNWDFSSYISNFSVSFSIFEPSATPYSSDFPGATMAHFFSITEMGFTADFWAYYSLASGFFNQHGNVTFSTVGGDDVLTRTTSIPPELNYIFPMSFGNNWAHIGASETVTEINGTPLFSSSDSLNITYSVDAYGTLTIPGEQPVDALRIKEDELRWTDFPFPSQTRTIEYFFITKPGIFFSVSTADEFQPDVGVISGSVTWNGLVATGVEPEVATITDYLLYQNYPNPFNPTTTINFSVPNLSFVTLKIFDVLGNEITTLVNEEKPMGNYEVEFDATNLSSGVYFYRLQASDFIDTKKMILLK